VVEKITKSLIENLIEEELEKNKKQELLTEGFWDKLLGSAEGGAEQVHAMLQNVPRVGGGIWKFITKGEKMDQVAPLRPVEIKNRIKAWRVLESHSKKLYEVIDDLELDIKWLKKEGVGEVEAFVVALEAIENLKNAFSNDKESGLLQNLELWTQAEKAGEVHDVDLEDEPESQDQKDTEVEPEVDIEPPVEYRADKSEQPKESSLEDDLKNIDLDSPLTDDELDVLDRIGFGPEALEQIEQRGT